MHPLSPLDMGFLFGESSATPLHVGGLYLFTLPEGAEEQGHVREVLDFMRSVDEWRRPFGHRLAFPLGPAGPAYWTEDDGLDIDYHVRHSALPKPGRYRELFALASRLHQSLLDRSRPLWEAHVIEGLQNRQFALYTKVHHAAIDGVTGVRLAQTMLSPDPSARREHSPFSMEAHRLSRADRAPSTPRATSTDRRNALEAFRQSLGLTRAVARGLWKYTSAWLQPDSVDLITSWGTTPATSLSQRITGARRFVAQSYALERIRQVGRSLDATINDVVLAMCGGALRRYLMDRDELPSKPLTALTPISLRTGSDDGTAGNAVGALTANLATHIADPEVRFEATQRSMREGKDILRGMSPQEVLLFSQLTQTPPLLLGVLGLSEVFPPYGTVISNVPGPSEDSYWNGAHLDGMYPMSAIFHGFALNITLISRAGFLDFGILADRRRVPRVQRFIDHLEASLAELEMVSGIAVD
jgi:diacylglycerol O-acyltransferase